MTDLMRERTPREELELSILATLLRRQERMRGVIELVDPKSFEKPRHQAVAQALVEIYRLRGCVEKREIHRRLGADEAHLAMWLMEQGDVLPPEADLVALLGSEEAAGSPGKLSVPLNRYTAQPCQWLWPSRVPLGELTVIGGETGSGKSLLACDLVARTTSGRAWPDGVGNSAFSAIVVASADDVQGAIRPRLDAARAAVDRVHVFPLGPEQQRQTSKNGDGLSEKLAVLERAIVEIDDCRLVVIDPFSPAARGTVPAGHDIPARPTSLGALARLASLAALARRRGVAVVALMTLAAARREADQAPLLAAAAEPAATVWLVARHPHRKELRWLLPAKNTRGPDQAGLSFTIDAALGEERLVWQDQVTDEGSGHRLSDAAHWLRQALADGPMKARELLALGEENGYTPRMLHYAKPVAGVAIVREGFGRGAAWHWILLAAHESPPCASA